MRRSLAGLILAAFLMAGAGCGSLRSATKSALTAEASVAVVEDIKAPGGQQRTLPWADLSRKASVKFKLTEPADTAKADRATPGVVGARERLRAREEALRDLGRQLADLPAAEPPPGERGDLKLLTFSERTPALSQWIADSLVSDAKEDVILTPDGVGAVSLEYPLQPLAFEVLRYGGGFMADAPVSLETGPRARASNDAKTKAQQDIMLRAMKLKAYGKRTFGDWAGENPVNRELLIESIKNAKPVRSELVRDGKTSKWVVELEWDPEALRKQIKKQQSTGGL